MTLRAPIRAGLVLFALGQGVTVRAQLATITTLDATGGRYTSVAYGPDGLALVSYYDAGNGDLKVARCLDVRCTSSTLATLDSAGDVGTDTSIAFGTDGRALIAYTDVTNGAVKLARCVDAACSSATFLVVDALAPLAARGVALAVGADGRPVVAYGDGGNPPAQPVRVARCTDAVCTGVSVLPLPERGGDVALAIGSDGLPLVAFVAEDQTSLRIRHCLDVACAASTAVTVPAAFTFPTTPWARQTAPSLAIGPDGLPILSHDLLATNPLPPQPETFISTYVRRCANVACTSILSSSPVATALGVTAAGFDANGPVVASESYAPQGLVFARCYTPSCTTLVADYVLGPGPGDTAASDISMARGPDGRHLIVFLNTGTGVLKAAYLDGPGGADLALSTTDTPDPAMPGQLLTYSLFASNQGPQMATNVTTRIVLSPGLEVSSSTCAYDAAAHALDCTAADVPAAITRLATLAHLRVREGVGPGDLLSTASITSAASDPDLSDNTAVITTRVPRWLEAEPQAVVETDGVVPAAFRITLRDTQPPGPTPVTVAFATVGGTAQVGSDYQAASGTVTFPPGTTVRTVDVGIVGDTVAESVEAFTLQLSSPVGAVLRVPSATETILDDDIGATRGELAHGIARTEVLTTVAPDPPGAHNYWIAQAPRASYEVVVDAASGDLLPLGLARLGGSGGIVLQTGSATGTGGAVSLAWINSSTTSDLGQLVRVTSGGCTTDCGADDTYRVRAYETTLRGPRFNNEGGQVTVLALQNPSHRTVAVRTWFFREDGMFPVTTTLTLEPHASVALNTTSFAASRSGSVVVAHDAPYGVLSGKLVSLEPATGLAFDTPLEARPR